MEWDVLRDVLSPSLAIAGAASSLYFALRSAKIQRESLRVQRDNDVLGWGNATIDTLSKLESIGLIDGSHPELTTQFQLKKVEYMADLSAMIDKGRMYFPNVHKDAHGMHKDSAFRGYRRPILDALADAYRAGERYQFGDSSPMQAVRQEINLSRCRFVSELQKSVDPDRRLKFLAQHAGVLQVDEVPEDLNADLHKARNPS